ncbi:hypothetical protein BDV35DRAFT_17825 [Aspergillus flavus]|uniref:Secreted protein n=1 Tax=Aspergillus flavus TaxID=5059 RepID=A0A5N6GK17_ASPFL|nr:hypothetical protein BDV35DRAFT_17825 [Aspergillus flavus]
MRKVDHLTLLPLALAGAVSETQLLGYSECPLPPHGAISLDFTRHRFLQRHRAGGRQSQDTGINHLSKTSP